MDKNISKEQPDKPDRFNSNANMSGLSGPSQRSLDKNLGNISEACTDITDKPPKAEHLSVMSVPPRGPK